MEFVFVTPREALFPECYPQGFRSFGSEEEAWSFLARLEQQGFFVERARAERTPAWKQLIPYCVVTHGDEVLLMRRRAKGGEARLHDKLSIGVGGHINPVDFEGDRAPEEPLVLAAARREIEEELEVRDAFELRLCGYLNDDSNPVGAVHLGLVFAAKAITSVHIREKDVLEGEMIHRDELRALAERDGTLETWSRILIGHLDELGLVQEHATTQSDL